jgi:hypothetical protein
MALELSYLSVNRVRRDKSGSSMEQPAAVGGKYDPVAEMKKDLADLQEAFDAPNLLEAVRAKLRQDMAGKRLALTEAKRRKEIKADKPIILGSKGLSRLKRDKNPHSRYPSK